MCVSLCSNLQLLFLIKAFILGCACLLYRFWIYWNTQTESGELCHIKSIFFWMLFPLEFFSVTHLRSGNCSVIYNNCLLYSHCRSLPNKIWCGCDRGATIEVVVLLSVNRKPTNTLLGKYHLYSNATLPIKCIKLHLFLLKGICSNNSKVTDNQKQWD